MSMIYDKDLDNIKLNAYFKSGTVGLKYPSVTHIIKGVEFFIYKLNNKLNMRFSWQVLIGFNASSCFKQVYFFLWTPNILPFLPVELVCCSLTLSP